MKKVLIFCMMTFFLVNVSAQEEQKTQEGVTSQEVAAIRMAGCKSSA